MRCVCRGLPPPLEISTNRQNRNPQPPQTTPCTAALPSPPVQAPPLLLHTAEATFDLAVPHGMPRAGHSHTGRALCAVVAECCLLLWTAPQTQQQRYPELWKAMLGLNGHKRIARFWSWICRYRPTTTTIAPKKIMN